MSSNGIIAYKNLLDMATNVVASSVSVGYPARNAWDGKTTTYWKPVGTGDHYLDIEFAGPVAADSFALFRHNLAAAEASIVLQHSEDDGATWSSCFTALTPENDQCLLQLFDEVESARWRIYIAGSSADVFLGVVMFGPCLRLYRGLPLGTALAGDSREVEVITSKPEGGAIAGRSVIPRGAQQDIEIQYVPEDWVREHWRPFRRHAEARPFFYSWNQSYRPEDCVYGEAKSPLPKDVMREFRFYNLQLSMSCLLSGE